MRKNIEKALKLQGASDKWLDDTFAGKMVMSDTQTIGAAVMTHIMLYPMKSKVSYDRYPKIS